MNYAPKNRDVRLEIVYRNDGNGGGGGVGGCPTLFSWNGNEYVEEEVLNIHAQSDITVYYEPEYLGPTGIIAKLSLRELDQDTSHIDYVNLWVIDSEGNWHDCDLIIAKHSKLGLVTIELYLDDEIRVDLAPSDVGDLFFRIPEIDIDHFIFEINGYNMKTY